MGRKDYLLKRNGSLLQGGGKAGELYTWGNQLKPDNKWMANIYEAYFLQRMKHSMVSLASRP
jgi:hypothetical protein